MVRFCKSKRERKGFRGKKRSQTLGKRREAKSKQGLSNKEKEEAKRAKRK